MQGRQRPGQSRERGRQLDLGSRGGAVQLRDGPRCVRGLPAAQRAGLLLRGGRARPRARVPLRRRPLRRKHVFHLKYAGSGRDGVSRAVRGVARVEGRLHDQRAPQRGAPPRLQTVHQAQGVRPSQTARRAREQPSGAPSPEHGARHADPPERDERRAALPALPHQPKHRPPVQRRKPLGTSAGESSGRNRDRFRGRNWRVLGPARAFDIKAPGLLSFGPGYWRLGSNRVTLEVDRVLITVYY
mmetsp:Transcript_53217/g.121281  ORF Transcript_53217/g.121281 Transcript_53217/m.121281 type:complete len:243 (-) Transcript_53217:21-749(-)